MKKVILVLAAVSMLAVVSCKKTCECTTYSNGQKTATMTKDKGDNKKCSDMNGKLELLGQSGEIKCK